MLANKNSIYFLRKIFDFLILNFSFFIAAAFAQSIELLFANKLMFVLLLILNITWFFSADIFDLYDEYSSRSFAFDISNIIKNSAVQILVSVTFLFIIKENLFTRFFILYYFLLLVILISIKKIIFRKVLKLLRKKDINLKNLIIIGNGEIGNSFSETINKTYDAGYKFLGFINDFENLSGNSLGKFDDLEKIILSNKIDDVVIALPNNEFEKIDSIIKICNRHAVRTHIIPDYFKFLSKQFKVTMFNNMPVITVRNEPLNEFHFKTIKRIFDIFVSSLFLIFVASWLFPLIIILQKILSPGPAFFIQDRIGRNAEVFKCYKFRTMKVEASKDQNFKATNENDPRITKFGNFLRKTNVDEFPQFINVFKGEMSVVGPRPAAISFNKTYNEFIDELKLRNTVKPGITGWAQVHGFRGDSADPDENKILIRKRFEFDLWYIENWSLWLDIQIILMTAWQIVKRDNKGI